MNRENFVKSATLYNLFFGHAMMDISIIISAYINMSQPIGTFVELQKQSIFWNEILRDTLEVYVGQGGNTLWSDTGYTESCTKQTLTMLDVPYEQYIIDYSVLTSPASTVGKLDYIYQRLGAITAKAYSKISDMQDILLRILKDKQTGTLYFGLPLSIVEFFARECEIYSAALDIIRDNTAHEFFVPSDMIIEHATYLYKSIDDKYDFDGYSQSIKKAIEQLNTHKTNDLYITVLSALCSAVVKNKLCTTALPLCIDHLARYAHATQMANRTKQG